jgi:hypothetical protein
MDEECEHFKLPPEFDLDRDHNAYPYGMSNRKDEYDER